MKFRVRLPTVWRLIDWWLYLIPTLLIGIGIAMITSLTYGGPRIDLAINQAIYAGLGFVAMVFFTRFDYRNWRTLAFYAYATIMGLLIAVDLVGVTVFGAQRWLAVGNFQLQPSELAKLGMVIVLARFFADRDTLHGRDYFKLLGLVSLPAILVLRQPDLGTTMILALTSFGLCLAGGVPRRVLAGVLGIGAVTLPIVWQFLADYQRSRILTFLHPAADPYGAGYNVLQALIAVGSGGLFGQGLGQGSQSQLQFLPVAHTDFIFAVVAEATGMIGSSILIGLLVLLCFRIVRVARQAKDQFGFLLGVGIALLILSQMAINIGMNIGLAPVTGIPLPFVSHGGTALITNFIAIGILQSIMLRHKKITF